ncbi:MAG: hypothetical protein H0T91_03235, partial [Propionibacteriaceae bacterium]|nr:hypothetical protein [Propionibacteriaceae bacterium]
VGSGIRQGKNISGVTVVGAAAGDAAVGSGVVAIGPPRSASSAVPQWEQNLARAGLSALPQKGQVIG